MLSVGKAAAMFGISRTALLYYDEIGLLKPSDRSCAGYRMYSDKDIEKLRQIMIFRNAGISLEDISRLVNETDNNVAAALLKRLSELNEEISEKKAQQAIILKIIKDGNKFKNLYTVDKNRWEKILESAGIDNETAEQLHCDFEKHSPENHQKLLEALGFDENEIKRIRKRVLKAGVDSNEKI